MVLFNLLLIIVNIILAMYFAPCPLDPVLWTEPFELPSLIGPLTPNKILQNHIKQGINEVLAPESMAFDEDSGDGFASLSDGRIVKLNKNGEYIITVMFKGSVDIPNLSSELANKMAWCHNESLSHKLAWNTENEKSCGRPLGLRFIKIDGKKFLYAIDAYNGIYVISLNKDNNPTSISHEITPSTKISNISSKSTVDPIIFKEPKFYNDLDVSKDGNIIYFSDSSYKHTRSQNRQELLDASPRGRLFKFDLTTKELTVLVCGLHFPNGVQINRSKQSKDEIFVVETTRFRILSVSKDIDPLVSSCSEYGSLYESLKHKNNSDIKVLLDHAPGVLDNLRLVRTVDKSSTYLVGVGAKSTKPFSLLWFAYQSNWLRLILGRIIPMKYMEHLVPKYGMVLHINDQGEILTSFQDPNGTIALISEAQRNPKTGDLWMGSHSNPYLAIVKNNNDLDILKSSK